MRTNTILRGMKVVMGLAAAGACGAFGTGVARGSLVYWDGTGTSWATVADWSTASGATTPNPAAVPGAGDVAVFNITTVNTAQTLTLDGAQSVAEMVLQTTGAVTINTGTGGQLTLGTSGILDEPNVGAVTINAGISTTVAELWENDSSNTLTATGNVALGGNLTLFGAGNFSLSGAVTGTTILRQGGNLTLSGTGNNTSLGLNVQTTSTVVLAKTSSSTVHALDGAISLFTGTTLQLAGTGGDQISDSSSVAMSGTATLNMNGKSEAINALTGSGIVTNTAASTASVLTIGAANGGGTYSGNITDGAGTMAIVKSGGGNETLGGTGGTYSYSGGLTVAGGNLTLGANGATGTGNLTVNGAHYIENGFNTTVANAFSGGNATSAGLASNLTIGGGNLTVTGEVKVWAGGGVLVFTSGMLTLGGLDMNGTPGNFFWSGGTLQFSGPVLFDTNHNLGNVITIAPGEALVSTGEQLASQTSNVTYNQTGGSNSSATWVEWGFSAGFTTTYNLSGGTLSAPSTGAGLDSTWGNGNVVFNQTGGAATFGDIEMAISATGSSSLTLNDPTGAATFTANDLFVGGSRTAAGGNASISITKGTMTVALLKVWSPTGSVTLNSGTLNAGVLDTSGSSTLFSWTSGNLNITGGGFLVDTTGPVGVTLSLPTGKNLTTFSGMTNNGTVTLSGGSIGGAGQIVNNLVMSGCGTLGGSGGFVNNGELSVTGGALVVSDTGFNENIGNLDLSVGSPLQITGGNFSNLGTINLNSSAVTGTATLINVGGTIVGRGLIQTQFQNLSGTLEVPAGTTTVTNVFMNSGVVYLTDPGASLNGNIVNNVGTLQGEGTVNLGVINTGTIEAVGGTLTLASMNNLLSAGGTVRVGAGNKLVASQGIATNSGTISMTGGTFDNNGFVIDNVGQITGYGTFSSGGLTNNGNFTLSGGVSTVNGNVTNASPQIMNVKFNQAIFTGTVINAAGATFKTTSTTVTFGGVFTNNGTYSSDPSTNVFQADVSNGSGAAMTGGAGDVFDFVGGTVTNSGNFSNGGTLESSDNVTNSGTFTQTGMQTWGSGTTFTNNGGSASFGSDTGSVSSSPLSVVVNAGVVSFSSDQHLNSLNIQSGNVSILSGVTKTSALVFGGSVNNWTGALDLTSAKLIVEDTANHAATLALVKSEVAYGRTHAAGIFSSVIPSDKTFVVSDNAVAHLTNFGGVNNVDAGSILETVAYKGDFNLDGVVDIQDLTTVANHWQQAVTDWSQGDFDGNGVVDILDLTAVANNWQAGVGSGGGSGEQSFAEALALVPGFGGVSSVPEPMSVGVLGIGGALMVGRRRRGK